MKVETVTLAFVFTKERVSKKSGKPFTSMSIKTKEHGEDVWLSGFQNKENRDWKEGDVVEIAIEEKVVDGKTYLNYSVPTEDQKKIAKLEAQLQKQDAPKVEEKSADDIDADDIPFE
jgi:hypothetical protein